MPWRILKKSLATLTRDVEMGVSAGRIYESLLLGAPSFRVFSIRYSGTRFALILHVARNILIFEHGDILVAQHKPSRIQQIAFRSGESAPVSGVWRMEHEQCQDAPELWVRKDDRFPPCPQCGAPASFILIEEVQHISEDADFG